MKFRLIASVLLVAILACAWVLGRDERPAAPTPAVPNAAPAPEFNL